MLKFLKNWALLVAICLGFLLHDTAGRLVFITPYLLFTMLLLTFCNISPRDLRFEPLHLLLLGVQVAGTIVLYALFAPFGALGAQAAAMSVFMPTATAAAVITGMLGGSIAFTAAYTCLCSIAVALFTPLLLPFVAIAHGPATSDVAFFSSMLAVAGRVMPVILLPLLIVWLLQYRAPKAHQWLLRWHEGAFWLWTLLLVVLMGSTFNFILSSGAGFWTVLGMAFIGAFSCCAQFLVGKALGARYGRLISGGQSLAQKNAALGMWLSFQYLDPVIAICCAAYSVTQNCINSFQLWRLRQAEATGFRLPHER